MRIYGIDFTSKPERKKPITCLDCVLDGSTLVAGNLYEWTKFEEFEAALRRPGPWITGIDLPFGQSRRFIENIGWPGTWQYYVSLVKNLERQEFRSELDNYRLLRAPGDKEHRRATDIAAGSISPQKLHGTPVGLMFYEGAPRLQEADVTIPGLQQGDPERVVVEAYPGVMARSLIGRVSYKHDSRSRQTQEQFDARKHLHRIITRKGALQLYGIDVDAPSKLCDVPTGDQIDALLCAIQAAWAWTRRDNNYGSPSCLDPLEGWIADPNLQYRV